MPLERISTGVTGLDTLIEGGIPRGFTVLVGGNPGTGKTILTSHFLYEGLTKGEPAVMFRSASPRRSSMIILSDLE